MQKLSNQITVNLDDAMRSQVEKIAEYYQRKPAELLRLLLTPVIIDTYAKIQLAQQAEKPTLETAIFRG